jgi:uncharacterized membrane protein
MNAKRSLENRVRGWFPTEPYRIGAKVNNEASFERKQPPLQIPLGYDIGTTKATIALAIFCTALCAFQIYLNIIDKVTFTVFQIFLIIVGVIVGSVLEKKIVSSQLNRLSRDYKFTSNVKELLLLSPMLIFLQ